MRVCDAGDGVEGTHFGKRYDEQHPKTNSNPQKIIRHKSSSKLSNRNQEYLFGRTLSQHNCQHWTKKWIYGYGKCNVQL